MPYEERLIALKANKFVSQVIEYVAGMRCCEYRARYYLPLLACCEYLALNLSIKALLGVEGGY